MEDWDEYIEDSLISKRKESLVLSTKELETKICSLETKACKDIDESKWGKTRFYYNGEEQKTQVTFGTSSGGAN